MLASIRLSNTFDPVQAKRVLYFIKKAGFLETLEPDLLVRKLCASIYVVSRTDNACSSIGQATMRKSKEL